MDFGAHSSFKGNISMWMPGICWYDVRFEWSKVGPPFSGRCRQKPTHHVDELLRAISSWCREMRRDVLLDRLRVSMWMLGIYWYDIRFERLEEFDLSGGCRQKPTSCRRELRSFVSLVSGLLAEWRDEKGCSPVGRWNRWEESIIVRGAIGYFIIRSELMRTVHCPACWIVTEQ